MKTKRLETTSGLALALSAGVLLGVSFTPAGAADLGGSCCGDLEERVAELEATTARKGNRVVSLQIYGQVNKALLLFDDGVDSDAFIVDNDHSGSRVGFQGRALIKPGWQAGFNIELDIQDSATNRVTRDNDEGIADEIRIRQNYVFIESERLGKISLGQQSTATDGINEVVLGNSIADSKDLFSSFSVRTSGGGDSGFEVGDLIDNLDGDRNDVVRYDSPSIFGFILTASWGDNDLADVALRFKKEFNSIRIAAGIGYQWDEQVEGDEKEVLSGSFSAMHVPSGIYVAASAGQVSFEADVDDGTFYYGQLGIEKKLLPYGSTTIYGEYGVYDGISAVAAADGIESERYGFGVVQKIDAAAMELYGQYRQYSFNEADLEDFTTVLIGSRIKF
jgi:predicted porin